jgi:hypothetical protein
MKKCPRLLSHPRRRGHPRRQGVLAGEVPPVPSAQKGLLGLCLVPCSAVVRGVSSALSGGFCRRIGRETSRFSTSAVTAHMNRTSASSIWPTATFEAQRRSLFPRGLTLPSRDGPSEAEHFARLSAMRRITAGEFLADVFAGRPAARAW